VSTELMVLLAAVALGGALNMMLIRYRWPALLEAPIDGGRYFGDGRRLFGDNKTWKGFVGMIGTTALATLAACSLGVLPGRTLFEAGMIGAALGLAYVAAELPNSFVKRRLDIHPGQLCASNRVRLLQLIVDQADSVLGCIVVLAFTTAYSLLDLMALAVIAVSVHFSMNILLYAAGLKRAWT